MPEPSTAPAAAPAPTTRERARDRKDAALRELAALLARAHQQGVKSLSAVELEKLPALYRYAATRLSRARTEGHDSSATLALARLVGAAHAVLYRDLSSPPGRRLVRAMQFLWADCPRAVRAEWRMLALSLLIFYGLALLSYVLVARDLELAFTFMGADMLGQELDQLQNLTPGTPFRGNFTFGWEGSASAAGQIIGRNLGVMVLIFAAALIPPLYAALLALNGLMVGTYLGVASHWDQAGNIASILMCHGVLELQALALVGAAGLVLARGLFTPGVWSRRHAMRLESARAWRLFAGNFPMLVAAGCIEGFVSPHAPIGVRIACMAASAALLVAWVAFGGREDTQSVAAAVDERV